MKKNTFVNILKFIAAILVIFSHSYAISKNDCDFLSKYTNDALNFGSLAVSILFVISGYYIMKSIDTKGLNNYIRKRVMRLIPSLFIVVVLSIIILGLFFSKLSIFKYLTNFNTYLYLLNIIFIPIHNLPGVFENNIYNSTVNGALWTMMIQFICYMYIYLFSKYIFIIKNKKNKYLIISFLLALFGYIVLKKLNIEILINMIRPFLCFVMGSYLFYFNYDKERLLYYISILLSLVCLVINTRVFINIFLVLFLPYIICYLCKNVYFYINNNYIDLLFSSSYELYLVGFPIQQAITAINGGKMSSSNNFIIGLFISISFSIIIKTLSDYSIKKLKL